MNRDLLRPIADHLWQSTLFATCVALLTLAFKANRAETRYWLWFAASAKFFIPFSWLIHAGSQFSWRAAPELSRISLPSLIKQATQPFAIAIPVAALPSAAPPPRDLLPAILFTVWSVGVLILICSWALRLYRIRSAIRSSIPVELPFPIQARTSEAFSEPGVFGLFKPVLLLPTKILNQLTPAEFEAIVTHELCHIRRRDNLTGTLHSVVEAIFWFHPSVWWIGSKLMQERERACDEHVLGNGCNPEVYAEGILKICALYLAKPLPGFSGITGSNLKQRIETIMANQIADQLTFVKRFVLTAAAAASLAVPLAIGLSNAPPLRAESQAQAPLSKPAPAAIREAAPPTGSSKSEVKIKPAEILLAQAVRSPAQTAPVGQPPTFSPAAIILVFDKSSSMDGQKIQYARNAVSRVIHMLLPGDNGTIQLPRFDDRPRTLAEFFGDVQLGVLTFSNSFEWAITPHRIEDRTIAETDQVLAAIRPDGGTNIGAALTEAYAQIQPLTAPTKHIILLTDGISEVGTSYDLARAANGNVSISTVGLGVDVNANYLETIAKLSGGNAYLVRDPQDLDRILLQDVVDHLRKTR